MPLMTHATWVTRIHEWTFICALINMGTHKWLSHSHVQHSWVSHVHMSGTHECETFVALIREWNSCAHATLMNVEHVSNSIICECPYLWVHIWMFMTDAHVKQVIHITCATLIHVNDSWLLMWVMSHESWLMNHDPWLTSRVMSHSHEWVTGHEYEWSHVAIKQGLFVTAHDCHGSWRMNHVCVCVCVCICVRAQGLGVAVATRNE